MLQSVNCHICEGKDSTLVKMESGWHVVRCDCCGLVYVNPQPDENFLKKHYQRYLPETQEGIETWDRMMEGIFKCSLKLINTRSPNKGKLLDIGCSHGFFLREAKKDGWTASGIDLSEQAVEYAKSKGLDASNSTLFDKKYPDGEFDVVTMLYVLEHLPDPSAFLSEVFRVLRPGGVLLLRVPHTTPIVSILSLLGVENTLYDTPSHLIDFSPKTIRTILEKHGFSDISTTIGGMTRPGPFTERMTSYFFGGLASVLAALSFNRCLLPGVSKTAIANKPSEL